MSKADKIKKYITEEKVFNAAELCRKTGIDRLHLHRFLSGEFQLQNAQVASLYEVLKKYGLK